MSTKRLPVKTNVHEKTARLPVDAWASKSTCWTNAGGFVSTSSCEGLPVPLLLLPRKTDGQIDRQTDRETDRRTDMLADVQTDVEGCFVSVGRRHRYVMKT